MTLYNYWKTYLKNNNRYIEIFSVEFPLKKPLINGLYTGKSDDIPISLADMEIITILKCINRLILEVISK